MKKQNTTNFSREKVYKEKITPLIEEISKICEENNIPYYFTACIANDENGSKYVTEAIAPKSYGIKITEDHFCDLENVSNGFKAQTAPASPMEINFSF